MQLLVWVLEPLLTLLLLLLKFPLVPGHEFVQGFTIRVTVVAAQVKVEGIEQLTSANNTR